MCDLEHFKEVLETYKAFVIHRRHHRHHHHHRYHHHRYHRIINPDVD
jgi:hypothetical protein